MHYTELAKELKKREPEYKNRDDRELVESYLERYPKDRNIIDMTDNDTTTSISANPKNKFIDKVSNTIDKVREPFLPVENTLTVGTAPLFAGARNVLFSSNPFKDTKRKFETGAEFYKQQLAGSKQKYPLYNFLGEVAGMSVPTKLGASIFLKGAKAGLPLLKNLPKLNSFTKSALEGAGIGGAYGFGEGAFGQKGKVADIKEGIKEGLENAVFGAGIGGAVNKVGSGIKSLLLSKEKSQNARLKDLLRNNDIPIEAYSILENADNELLGKIQARDLRTSFKQHQENFDKKLKDFRKEIKETANKSYKKIENEKILLDDESATNILKDIENYENTPNLLDKNSETKIKEKIAKLKDFLEKNKGKEIDLNTWQNQRQNLFEAKNDILDVNGKAIGEKGGEALQNVFSNARKTLFNLKTINPEVQAVTKEYASMMDALGHLKKVFGKNFENKDVGRRLLNELQEKKTGDVTTAIKNMFEAVKGISGLNNFAKDLSDTSKLMQLSYMFKPANTSGEFEKIVNSSKTKNKLSLLAKVFPFLDTPIDKYQRLAKAIKEGSYDAGKLGENYYLSRDFKNSNINDIIEKFYNRPKALQNPLIGATKNIAIRTAMNPITRAYFTNKEQIK